MNEKEKEGNPNRHRERGREIGISSKMKFNSSTFSDLALLVIKSNRKK